MLRSMYVNLLDHIESHTLAFLPYGTEPVPETLAERHALHAAIIDAVEDRDRDRALHLIRQHKTPGAAPGDAAPGG
jgi:DNA-binding GntR family transcriptional regulator